MPPLMDVMTALLIAFIFGIGIASIKGNALEKIFDELQEIVEKVISVSLFHYFHSIFLVFL